MEDFTAYITANYLKPAPCNIDLDTVATGFKTEPKWLARVRVLQIATGNDKYKTEVLELYESLTKDTDDIMLLIEAARAAAVVDDMETLHMYLQKAQFLKKFSPNLTGAHVKYSTHQQPNTRLTCLIQPSRCDSDSESNGFENVAVHSDGVWFPAPEYVNNDEQKQATGVLDTAEYLLLLLNAAYAMHGPSSSIVGNEQALPFIRRVTDTVPFTDVPHLVQLQGLYERSILEVKDITELERGTVQLLKLSTELHAGTTSLLMDLFHYIVPLGWKEVDTMAARRLVAMSDFANAIPLYELLDAPLDLALCLTATGRNDEALKVLNAPELAENPQALLLRGDIAQNPKDWEAAWSYKLPQAKFRLAQNALAQNDRKGALVHAEDLLTIQPSNTDALRIAGSASLTLQEWARAATHLRRRLALQDDDARGWSDLATALLQQDQSAIARHALQQSIRVNQNGKADLPTWTNFVALSAQLGKWDDVVVGISRLCSEEGGASYVVRLSSVLPRLVAAKISEPFIGTGAQQQLIKLLTKDLITVIPSDDPILCRLTAQTNLWANKYQSGLELYDEAYKAARRVITENPSDANRARVQLYAREFITALNKYGDKEGRMGPQAYPKWKERVEEVRKETD